MKDDANQKTCMYKPSEHLFVSVSLKVWHTEQPDAFVRDFKIDNMVYRRLDPEYYAWLRAMMHKAKKAVAAGELSESEFDDVRERFNAIHEWAMQHFGEQVLREAAKRVVPRLYDPPPPTMEKQSTYDYVDDHDEIGLPAGRLNMVDAIREKALALGWAEEALYSTGKTVHGKFCESRSLAKLLRPHHRIGDVTREFIEILLPSGGTLRFYNPDVEQPWVHRVERAEVTENKAVA